MTTTEEQPVETRLWEVFKQDINFAAGDRWENTRTIRVPAGAVLAGMVPSQYGAVLLYTVAHPTESEAEAEAQYARMVKLETVLSDGEDLSAEDARTLLASVGFGKAVTEEVLGNEDGLPTGDEDEEDFEQALRRMEEESEKAEGGSNDDID